MDVERFDHWTRSLATASSRRSLVGALGQIALAFPGLGAAKKHHKHKKHKHRSLGCKPACAGWVCGDDGCGGSCGVDCAEPRVCHDGACACPSGQKDCQGTCISSDQCCADGDCPSNSACCGGTCVDVTDDKSHCGNCDVACLSEQSCVEGQCCTPLYSHCSTDRDCCGTDRCYPNVLECGPCLATGVECLDEFETFCCPGLACVHPQSGNPTCASCVGEGKPCPQNVDCCTGLFCQGNVCKPPG
jgi:hypothetical protein